MFVGGLSWQTCPGKLLTQRYHDFFLHFILVGDKNFKKSDFSVCVLKGVKLTSVNVVPDNKKHHTQFEENANIFKSF